MLPWLNRLPPTWDTTNLKAVEDVLATEFPHLSPQLRRAIVTLAAQELKPKSGVARLSQLVIRYARECPRTIGMEAALVS